MNIMELGALGEFVGSIAVVITLVYLATQIRQNSRQLRGQAQIALTEATQRLLSELRENPGIADVNIRLSNDWENAKEASEKRFAMWWNQDEALLNELAFVLWRQGIIDEATYLAKEEYWLRVLQMPGKRKWWDEYVYYLSPDFVTRIDGKLAKLDQMDKADLEKRFAGSFAGRDPFPMYLSE